MYVLTYSYPRIHVSVEVRGQPQVSFLMLSTLFLRHGPLVRNSPDCPSCHLARLQASPCLCLSQRCCFKYVSPPPTFKHRFWRLGSGPHTCRSRVYQPNHLPTPRSLLLKNSKLSSFHHTFFFNVCGCVYVVWWSVCFYCGLGMSFLLLPYGSQGLNSGHQA